MISQIHTFDKDSMLSLNLNMWISSRNSNTLVYVILSFHFAALLSAQINETKHASQVSRLQTLL